jgi:hypothetical protein
LIFFPVPVVFGVGGGKGCAVEQCTHFALGGWVHFGVGSEDCVVSGADVGDDAGGDDDDDDDDVDDGGGGASIIKYNIAP